MGERMKIEEVLSLEGRYVAPTQGVSMFPMLKTGRDSVVIRKKEGRLAPLDVALYKRGDAYILHRVLSVTDEGYIIRGDNCYADEIVPEEAVIGVLSEFFRKDKHYFCTDKKYLRYARRRVRNYPIRRFFRRLKKGIRRILSKVKRMALAPFRRKK